LVFAQTKYAKIRRRHAEYLQEHVFRLSTLRPRRHRAAC